MFENVAPVVRRALVYLVGATVVGAGLGFVREWSVATGLTLGFTVGVGVALGILVYEAAKRYLLG